MMKMAEKQRGPLEEIARRLRGFIEDLDRLISPQPAPKPVRVPVPVPVRPDRRPRSYDPYR
jgi:hypothetical protein